MFLMARSIKIHNQMRSSVSTCPLLLLLFKVVLLLAHVQSLSLCLLIVIIIDRKKLNRKLDWLNGSNLWGVIEEDRTNEEKKNGRKRNSHSWRWFVCKKATHNKLENYSFHSSFSFCLFRCRLCKTHNMIST